MAAAGEDAAAVAVAVGAAAQAAEAAADAAVAAYKPKAKRSKAAPAPPSGCYCCKGLPAANLRSASPQIQGTSWRPAGLHAMACIAVWPMAVAGLLVHFGSTEHWQVAVASTVCWHKAASMAHAGPPSMKLTLACLTAAGTGSTCIWLLTPPYV